MKQISTLEICISLVSEVPSALGSLLVDKLL